MRLVYFGSGAFGLPTLRWLSERHEIALVVTQPDKPAGRGGRVSPTPIGAFAQEHLGGMEIIKPQRIRDEDVVSRIRAVESDAWVVIAYGQKLPAGLLADRFAINLHASLLPRWRGAAPINAAILGGDTTTGNSVITLADRMDAGLILGQSTRAVEPTMTAGELHDALASDGPELVERVLLEKQRGTLRPIAQDESLVTIAGKLSKDDDDIDFAMPADFLRRQVLALTPWPGISVSVVPAAGGAVVMGFKVLRVKTGERRQDDPGQRVGTLVDARRGVVLCGHGSTLELLEVQPPGKRGMRWDEFARGAGRALESGGFVLVASREAQEPGRRGGGD